ncbi:hypothetical protein Mapa_006962 [Marchantia paleacea]|nr:hypothetical protein Mapa_006962 [Marchantia paleacea]
MTRLIHVALHGFSTLLRLTFEDGRLIASHSQLRSDAHNAGQKFQRVAYQEFSAPPQENLLARLGNLAGMVAGSNLTDSANTGVIRLGDGRVLCLTETVKGAHHIDPDTLETMGRFKKEDNLGEEDAYLRRIFGAEREYGWMYKRCQLAARTFQLGYSGD